MRTLTMVLVSAALVLSGCGDDDPVATGTGDTGTDTGVDTADVVETPDEGSDTGDEPDVKPPTPDFVVPPPDTNKPDVGAPDAGPVTPATTCAEAVDCVLDCGKNGDCHAACVEGSEQDIKDRLAVVTDCVDTDCSPAGLKGTGAMVQCMVDDCYDQLYGCYFDGTSDATGDALNCEQMTTCVENDCDEDDVSCFLACLVKGDAESQKAYVTYNFCVTDYCIANPEDLECKKTADQTNCSTSYGFCFSN